MSNHPEDYKSAVKAAALDENAFLRMTLSKKLRDDGTPWVRIAVRPVVVKGERALQFSYFDRTRDVSKNFGADEAARRLDEALELPFGQILVQSTTGDLQVRVNRKGHVHVKRAKPSRQERVPDLAHDRTKSHPLPLAAAPALYQALGLADPDGHLRPGMQGKLHQVSEFLRLLDQAVPAASGAPLEVVDCGCGSAYLTFVAFHYLRTVRSLAVHAVGVDTNAELIAGCTGLRDSLGWDGLDFHTSAIADYRPAAPPDVVVSLHACDTATDEALAQAVRWKARLILAAPCCQHELHHQLKSAALRAVLRHGILRERLADIVTDAFRALVLRLMGYRTSVVEFVSPDRTAKNLLIRAERGIKPGDPALLEEYADLKNFWNVTPAIEPMLDAEFARFGARGDGRPRTRS